MTLIRSAVQDGLRAIPETSRLAALQRCTLLYAQSQAADALFLVEEGLVKLTRTNGAGGKIILSICGPGQIVGEEALAAEEQPYYSEAMSITAATVHRIPRESARAAVSADGHLAAELMTYLLERKLALAEKVELLCLHDVEYRILHYLAQLAELLPVVANGDGYQIPITQLELADLIGATRETTSTTLNQLERRGLLKLSRRLLTVPSPAGLRAAAATRTTPVAHGAVNGTTS